MESIATVRPDMAVLDKNKLMLSPFGALSHALAEEILARTGQAEGVYPYVPLELLNEPEAEPEAKAGEPAVNVEVKLTLELTQEARELRERTETVERILERIERIRERSEVAQKPMSWERDAAQPAESRSFFQNINQHISFPMTLSAPDTAGTAQPGGIARISEKFVNTLRTMREEGLYQEPGGETQRVADVGRGDAKIAGGEAAGSGAASGEVGGAAADRAVTSGRTDLSGADFAVRAAETELNTSGMNERSPETAARAAERIGEKIAESAAREIAEKFDELAKREDQAGDGAVTGRDGGAGAATRDVDNERGQGVRDNDRGQGAHGDMETGRPSMTRRREAQNRENPEITEGADGEKAYATLTGTRDRTGEGTDGSGGTSPENRREAAGIESEDRPARAVPVINEDRPAAPEELTLAADARPERSGEETFRAGRETWEDTRRAHVKESRAKGEHENGAAPRRAGKNPARGEADEDTADTAGGTGTVEMAEGRTVAGETEKPGISQNAGEEGAASRSGHGREGVGPEAPEVAAVSREELTEEPPHRARGVAAPESEERGTDGGYRTGAEAIPLRGESEMPAPEELTLSSAAERSGEVSPTVGRQTTVDGGQAIDRAKSTVESDRKNLTHMTGAAEVDTTAGEATVRGADRAGHGTGSSESAGDTVRTETVRETGPVREAGKAGELKAAERNATKVGTAEAGEAGRAERPVEAIPERERPYMPAPEELALRKEETAAPEGVAHNVGETQNEAEGRKVRGTRDASESYDVREARNAGEAHDAVKGRDVRETRDAGEIYDSGTAHDTGVAEAIPLRGEFVEVTPEELALARAEETVKPDGGRTGDTARGAAADEKRDTHPHSGETVHIDGKTGRPGRASAAIVEDGGEETGGTGRTSEKTGRAGKAGEIRTAEGESARAGTVETGEAGWTESTVEAIPERERPYMPAPDELALRKEETAAPEGGAHNVGETQNEIEDRKVRGTRDARESYDVREARNAGEAHDAVKGRNVRETRDGGEIYDAGTARDTGAAEAIPLRGKFVEVTPEELALARAEETAKPDGGRTGDTARGAATDEKRDTHPHSGENVHIDGKTGRPGRASAAIGEDGGEEAGGTGRTSEKTGGAGTVETREAGRTERAVEAIPERERPYMPAPEELSLRNEETVAPEGGAHNVGEAQNEVESRKVRGTRDAGEIYDSGTAHDTGVVEAIPLRGEFVEVTPEELTLARAEETAEPDGGRTGDTARGAAADEKRDTHPHGGETVHIDGKTGRPGRASAAIGEDGGEETGGTGRTSEKTGRAGKAGEIRTAEGEAARAETVEAGEAGRTKRAVEAIPERERPYVPAPEELAFRKEETAAPEGGAHNVGETQNEIEDRKVRGTRDASESYDVREARNAGEAHDAVKGRDVSEARDTGEFYDAGTAHNTGVAEAIPLRGKFAEVTPEELALAQSEETAKPDGGRTGDTVRGAAADEKRDTHPHGGEYVHIDGKTGRPGRASAAIGEDGGEETGGTGRTSEKTGRAGKAGEIRTAEGEAARAGTVEAGEAGRAERAVEAIPEWERPYMPAPEELSLRKEETAAPEGGVIFSPGSTAKSVEAFAEGIAEKARRAERSGIRAGDGNRSVASAGRSGPEAGIPQRGSAAGAGTVGFPPPVELIGAAEGARDAGIAGDEAERGTRTERTAGGREYGDTTMRPGTVSADGTDNLTGGEARRARRTAERASAGSTVAGPAPVELAYGGTGDARADGQSRTQPAGNIAESEYVKSLPDWARRFLKEGAGSLGTAGSMAVTSIPDTGKAQNKKPQMMEWTAPGYQPTPPAETQFKELKPPEDTGTQAGEVQISDAEIRRTADRVYKIIEDRIRRERRRLGL